MKVISSDTLGVIGANFVTYIVLVCAQERKKRKRKRGRTNMAMNLET